MHLDLFIHLFIYMDNNNFFINKYIANCKENYKSLLSQYYFWASGRSKKHAVFPNLN